MEDPADTKDRPKPAPASDISDYKMETIRDPGSAGPMIAFAVLVAVVMVLMLVWS